MPVSATPPRVRPGGEAVAPPRQITPEVLADAVRLLATRRAALALAAGIAGEWFIAAAISDSVFMLGGYLTISAVFAAVLLCATAAGVHLAGRLAALRRPAATAAATALLVLAADEGLALHDHLRDVSAVLGTALYALVVLAAAAVWLRTSRELVAPARRLWQAGSALWLVAGAMSLAEAEAGTALRSVEELVALAGAGALLAGTVALVASARAGVARPDVWPLVLDLAAALDVRRLAIMAAALIAALATIGAVVIAGVVDWHVFDLRDEGTVPAYVSGSFEAAGAAFALALLPFAESEGIPRGWVIVLAVFLAWLGADEVGAVHDRLNTRTGITGQAFLVPLAVPGGIGLLLLLRRLRDARARVLLVAGATVCVISQILDLMPRPEDLIKWFILAEETLEMTGLALLALGLLTAVQTTREQALAWENARHARSEPAIQHGASSGTVP